MLFSVFVFFFDRLSSSVFSIGIIVLFAFPSAVALEEEHAGTEEKEVAIEHGIPPPTAEERIREGKGGIRVVVVATAGADDAAIESA